ncbi:hypothetical protein A8L34_00660 [Bacillus sp. FJAT-27264]|nr:hypothetical protein A8L34_00660 [Bacillus sp. FJAT-27264]
MIKLYFVFKYIMVNRLINDDEKVESRSPARPGRLFALFLKMERLNIFLHGEDNRTLVGIPGAI